MKISLKTLLAELVRFPSISPEDAGCQVYMMDFFKRLGFNCQEFNQAPVSNFFARIGDQAPLLVFAGHSDVVPAGEGSDWQSPPFELHERKGKLFGRGVADMKGGLAAMMYAAHNLLAHYPEFKGSLGFLITSGEEGDDFDKGTPYVMSELQKQGTVIDYCIVGEPSSTARVGDVIKVGRRGSLSLQLKLEGIHGHVAYPHLAKNPIHLISPVLHELSTSVWDAGNAYFPPTTFQITHIHSSGQASNVIPGLLELHANFRFSTEQQYEQLISRVETCFQRHGLNPLISWRLNGEPFLTDKGMLVDTCSRIIADIVGEKPELSTSGGTSDGRFIAPYGVEVLELGLINSTIHQVNECTSLQDLEILSKLYFQICLALLK